MLSAQAGEEAPAGAGAEGIVLTVWHCLQRTFFPAYSSGTL